MRYNQYMLKTPYDQLFNVNTTRIAAYRCPCIQHHNGRTGSNVVVEVGSLLIEYVNSLLKAHE